MDYYYKNLSISNKITILIPDKYIDISYYNLVLIVYKVGYKYL
jgi:hypothetical protein